MLGNLKYSPSKKQNEIITWCGIRSYSIDQNGASFYHSIVALRWVKIVIVGDWYAPPKDIKALAKYFLSWYAHRKVFI